MALQPSVVVVAVMSCNVHVSTASARWECPCNRARDRLAGIPVLAQTGHTHEYGPIANRAAASLDAELQRIRSQYQQRTPVRVLYQIWDMPIYTIGGRHVINDALQVCGARNLFADLATAAPAVTREAVLARDPELILASGPPGASEPWLAEWRRFSSLAAVRSGQLVALRMNGSSHGSIGHRGYANLCTVIVARARRGARGATIDCQLVRLWAHSILRGASTAESFAAACV